MEQRDASFRHALAHELRDWVKALLVAIPVVGAVVVLMGAVPGPWRASLLALLMIGPFVIIGFLSQSSIWVFLVWLGPLVILVGVLVLTGYSVGLAAALVLVTIWTGGIMLYASFGKAVFAALDGVFQGLVGAGLTEAKRAAYDGLRRALRPAEAVVRDQRQLEDLPRAIRAMREPGSQILALPAPDARWAQVLEAAAAPSLQYAEMLEGTRIMDFDVARALVARRNHLIHELLTDESLPYRVLTYVPFGRDRSN